jgi:hypothetical protein
LQSSPVLGPLLTPSWLDSEALWRSEDASDGSRYLQNREALQIRGSKAAASLGMVRKGAWSMIRRGVPVGLVVLSNLSVPWIFASLQS